MLYTFFLEKAKSFGNFIMHLIGGICLGDILVMIEEGNIGAVRSMRLNLFLGNIKPFLHHLPIGQPLPDNNLFFFLNTTRFATLVKHLYI